MSFTGEQHNFYDQPSRLFLMDASLVGIPVHAFHRFIVRDALCVPRREYDFIQTA